MNIKFASGAAVLLLVSGCAQNPTVKPPAEPPVSSPVAGDTSRGSSMIAAEQGGTGVQRARTRAEVHAEAVEAVRNYKSTLVDEHEWFMPDWSKQR